MRAAIFVGTPELSVEDVNPLDPGPRDVVGGIGASGVMASRTIRLDELNDAFRAMQAGEVIRSVVTSA